MPPPIVLAIGGFDGSGGAGVLADARSIQLNGGYACSVLTAISAQNTSSVREVDAVDGRFVRRQLDVIFDDVRVDAVKVGLIPNRDCLDALVEFLIERVFDGPIVLDPVFQSSSGTRFIDDATVIAMRDLLFPRVEIVTPNIDEAETLAGQSINDVAGAIRAGKRILASGCEHVVVKGGHLTKSRGTDVWYREDSYELLHATISYAGSVRGTGCMFASALATYLARKVSVRKAISSAKVFVERTLVHRYAIGHGMPVTTVGIRSENT